jgi:hypothetical protein
LTKLLANRL